MHPNAVPIDRFYKAFALREWAATASCYHPQVHFGDEVFDLRCGDAAMMWRMLCTTGRDLRLVHRDVAADDRAGSCHWAPTTPSAPPGAGCTTRSTRSSRSRTG